MTEGKARILADVRVSVRHKLDELTEKTGVTRKDIIEELIEKHYAEVIGERQGDQ